MLVTIMTSRGYTEGVRQHNRRRCQESEACKHDRPPRPSITLIIVRILISIISNTLPGVSGNDFWTFGNGNGNGSAHSQTLGTGTGMINCIPNFWEREREWKFHSQFLGTGMEIPFPNFGNGNKTLLFPGMGTGMASQNWVKNCHF